MTTNNCFLSEIIFDILFDKINKNETFSAYSITKDVRDYVKNNMFNLMDCEFSDSKLGYTIPHANVKAFVHKYMSYRGEDEGYTQYSNGVFIEYSPKNELFKCTDTDCAVCVEDGDIKEIKIITPAPVAKLTQTETALDILRRNKII